MNDKTEQLRAQYASCPVSAKEYVSEGNKFTVIRHFTGDKELKKTVLGIARERAGRESGVP